MLQGLRPDRLVDSAYDLNPEELLAMGLKGLIVDIDNTLVGWNAPAEPWVAEWIAGLKRVGLSVCLVSNGRRERVRRFAAAAGAPAVARAKKPTGAGFRRALEILDLPPREVAVVGDQIFTDILGGNRLGLYTILVVPVAAREFFGTRLSRAAERLVLRRLGLYG